MLKKIVNKKYKMSKMKWKQWRNGVRDMLFESRTGESKGNSGNENSGKKTLSRWLASS